MTLENAKWRGKDADSKAPKGRATVMKCREEEVEGKNEEQPALCWGSSGQGVQVHIPQARCFGMVPENHGPTLSQR